MKKWIKKVEVKTESFCRGVDFINNWTGKLVSILLVPLVIITMLEVILRYFFNSPTIWGLDVNIQLAATLIVLSGGCVLLYREHITLDVVVGRLSSRVRAILDLITSPIFFIGFGWLLWIALKRARASILGSEHYSSLWAPPLYPLKVIVVLGIILLLLQGLVKFIRDLRSITRLQEEDAS